MYGRYLSIPVGIAALGLSACGGGEPKEMGAAEAPSAQTVRAPGAKVAFTRPKGETTGSKVTARVALSGFKLSKKAVGKRPKEGQGHLHFSMDEGHFDAPQHSGKNGKMAQRLGVVGKYSPATEPKITYSKLPPGDHTLEVYLANNDHSATGVKASTTFTVRKKKRKK